MYLINFLSISLMLGLLPLMSFGVYSRIYRWEKKQIALDNAGIVFGRISREMFDEIQARNGELQKLDLLHHIPHICARFPNPNIESCVVQDGVAEATMAALHAKIFADAQVKWRSARRRAEEEIRKLEGEADIEGCLPVPPIIPTVCSVCGVNTGWMPATPIIPISFVARREPRVHTRLRIYPGVLGKVEGSEYRIMGDSIPRGMRWD